MIKSNIQNFI